MENKQADGQTSRQMNKIILNQLREFQLTWFIKTQTKLSFSLN